MRRRSLVVLAVAASLAGGVGAAAASGHDDPDPWVCVAVGPPVDRGYCQYDPLPESLP